LSQTDIIVPDLGNFDTVAVVEVLVKVGDVVELEVSTEDEITNQFDDDSGNAPRWLIREDEGDGPLSADASGNGWVLDFSSGGGGDGASIEEGVNKSARRFNGTNYGEGYSFFRGIWRELTGGRRLIAANA
jgi:hypothetical protein